MKKCPFCQEEIQDSAVKCRYCGEWLYKQDETSSNTGVDSDKITTPTMPSPKQDTITPTYVGKSNNPEIGKKIFRWGGFVVGSIFLIVLYAVWKDFDKTHGGGFITGFLRGMICIGGIIWLFYWASSKPQNTAMQLKTNNDSDSDKQIPSDKISLWNWKSLILAIVIGTFLVMVVAGITGTKPPKNMLWTWLWIYLTVEAWKDWKWKALLPFPLYLFVLTIGFLFLKSAGVEYHSTPVAILLIVSNMGGLAIFYMLLNRARSSVTPETFVNEEIKIEKIIRDAETKTSEKVKNDSTYNSTSEAQHNDEEFIELLKSSINENGLNNIPGKELLEIYHRAKFIDAAGNNHDIELSKTINTISDELKKRGLSPDVQPQEKARFEESSSLAKEERKAATAKVVIAIILVVAIAVVFLFLNDIRSNSPNQTQNNYTVTETQAMPQELTAEEWVEKAKALLVDGKFTDPQKAIEYLNNAIKLDPNYAKSYQGRGIAYSDLGQYQRAIIDYDEAIRLDSYDHIAYFNRAAAYDDLGRYQRAIEDYNEAIRLKPDDSYAYFFRGGAYAGLGQHQQAIENYSEAIRLGLNDAISYSSRGKSHNAMKQYEKAIADLNKAIQLDPNFPGSYRHRGNTYRNLGQYQQAIKDFNEAIRLKADYVEAYKDRGQVYLSKNNKHLGCNDAQKACDLGNCELLEASKNSGVCH